MVKEFIKEAELVAIRDAYYSIYVFKTADNDYIMCTRLPNWQVPEIEIGMKGFLQYQIVKAGDEYITPEGEAIVYKYSNCYFLNFVNNTDDIKSNEITL